MIDAIMTVFVYILFINIVAFGAAVMLAFDIYVACKCWEIAKDIWKKIIEMFKGEEYSSEGEECRATRKY